MRRASPNAMVQNEDEHRPLQSYPGGNMRRAIPTSGARINTVPLASPPPAHSRLVFKICSLKGKQRRAPERADKDAAYISRGSAHLCVDRTPYEP